MKNEKLLELILYVIGKDKAELANSKEEKPMIDMQLIYDSIAQSTEAHRQEELEELEQERLAEMEKRLLIAIKNAKKSVPAVDDVWRGSMNAERLYFLHVLETILGKKQTDE